ncbi:rhomboid family intramembrane serine protease [Marinobacter alexandrii]|uniref:rhomboid family intramembrane serine protease n=1 Tax=Marinobacter alexandrii TaxID=2570351 RepID=UPI00329788FD
MTFAHTALSVGVEEDLLPLSAVLKQHGVAHRVFEERGQQELKVSSPEAVAQVKALYEAWRSGQVKIEVTQSPRMPTPSLVQRLRVAPVTAVLILLSIAGFLLIYFQLPLTILSYFTFSPLVVMGDSISFGEMGGQYWRLITPAFLHFGWLHIVFNSLWLWELGARVERVMGGLNMLGLFLVIAMVSNACQYLFGGPSLFGGMSGVVYGLLGFSWAGAKVQPAWQIAPPTGIMVFMVGWLVVCMLGVVEVLGFGAIANAAHVGGLVSGAILGVVFALSSRSSTS